MHKSFIVNSILVCFLHTLFCWNSVLCQELTNMNSDILSVRMRYGIDLPFAKMKDKFGANFLVGGDIEYQMKKSTWFLGLEYGYIFGSKVKTNPLAWIQDEFGYVIGNARDISSVFLRERGHEMSIYCGKIFSFKNPNHAIRIGLNAGYLIYKIKYIDDFNTAIQIQDPYKNGYDRLSGGPMIGQRIAYHFINPKGNINFAVALFAKQAFTKNFRSWNFGPDGATNNGLDMLMGININWALTFKVRQNADQIEY
jgi:hypothetical protein